MKRTMVYLPEDTYLVLRWTSEREKRPMAEIVRELLKTGLSKKKFPSGYSFLKKLEKYKIKEGKNLAKRIDEIYK